MSEVSENMKTWMLVHMRLGKSHVSFNALQQAWKASFRPTESFENRRVTEGMLDKLLKKKAEIGAILVESDEKKERGYYFEAEELPGEIEENYFHWNEDDGFEHEAEYRHPGTTLDSDDESAGIEGELFTAITTVAGQRLSSITFVAPQSDDDSITRCDLHPSYQMQLTMRTDDHRKYLYYDCFEYKPTWWKPKTGDLPTNKEYRKALETLGVGRDHDPYESSEDSGDEDDDSPIAFAPEVAADPKELMKIKIAAKLTAHAGAFMHSRMFRIQVPLSAICGLRVHAPKHKEDEEDQSVLILELRQPASSFAVRCVSSNLKGDNKFCSIDDWTPGKLASKATRHYICGKTDEINNIASHLAAISESSVVPDEKPKKKKRRKKSGRKTTRFVSPNTLDNADISLKSAPTPQAASATPATSKTAAKKESKLSADDVHNILIEKCGVTDVEAVSNCLKRAILEGHVKIDKGLESVVMTGECLDCPEMITCTVGDILYQRDYAGLDYADNGQDASLRCPTAKCKKHNEYECEEEECEQKNEICPGIYVTMMCQGQPRFDCGKFHNHCTNCDDFGVCIHDYREAHCEDCGEHFFMGNSGFPCPHCGGGEGRGRKGKPVDERELPPDSVWDGWVEGYTEADEEEDIKKLQGAFVQLLHNPDDFNPYEACGMQ